MRDATPKPILAIVALPSRNEKNNSPHSDALLDAATDTHGGPATPGPSPAEHGPAGPRLLHAGPPQILTKRRQILHKRKRARRPK